MSFFSGLNGTLTTGLLVGLIIIAFYAPYTLARGVMQLIYGKDLDIGITLKCLIPFYNIYTADVGYFGHISWATYGMLALLVIPLRIVCWYFMYDNNVISLLSIILFWVGIIFWYFTNVATSVIIINDSSIMPIWKAILYSIIYPFGYAYIGNILVAAMNRKASKLSGGGRL